MTDWVGALRSYVTAFRASSLLGRVTKLRRSGHDVEALAVAQHGLGLLREPGVRRDQPAEGSVLVTLTMAVEQLAHQLRRPGAARVDLQDSVRYLNYIGPGGRKSVRQMRGEWLPYLEARLQTSPQDET